MAPDKDVTYGRVRDYEEGVLLRRLKWFLFCRLSIAVLGIIAILIYQGTLREFPPHIMAAYFILIFACFVNIFYLVLIKWFLVDLKKLALLQISLDIVLETSLIYFTGGVGSIFAYLYFASILASALLVSARSSFFFASLATLLLASISITYSLSARLHFPLPFIPDEYITATFKELEFILPYLFFFALSLHFVAILAGRLSIELSREKILKEDILQNMINGLVVVDKEGKLVFYNPPARAMLQISENPKPTGSPIDRILSGSRYDILREAMLNKKEIHQEIELRDKQGKNVSIEIATSVLTNPKGQLRGVIAVLNDISLKKAMEEVVKRMETLQALSEMSTGIAHEIRNPLASVKSAIQQLAANLKLAGDDKKLMSIIIKESDRLNRIITDFLEFARERPLVIQECNLNELIEEVIILLGKKDEQKDVAIQAELAGSLTCEGDAEQLKQVFLNLGLNAIESSRDHSRVVIRGYTNDGENNTSGVTVEIIDSGVGIEPANLERIYDPFYTTKPKGVGLGLAIASRIIQRHQGKVFVQSRLRDGTKFSVWLPSRILSEEVKS